jgi:DNA topoisomerase-1
MAPDELTLEAALELLAKGEEGPRSLGTDPETGLSVYVKIGRFGPYFQLGDPESLDGEKPKMASLLKGMEPETVTLDQALQVLALPKSLGTKKTDDTEDGPGEEIDVLAANGRYGPYIKWGKETRSIPEGESPISITYERACQLLAEPKRRGRQRAAAKVLKELGEHPDSGDAVRMLDGRYGPYVTDGTTNASVPRGENPDQVNLNRAVELLAERAARGPAKKKKKTKKKKAAKKKSGSNKTGTAKASDKRAAPAQKKAAPKKKSQV